MSQIRAHPEADGRGRQTSVRESFASTAGVGRSRAVSGQPHVALIVETSSAYGRQILKGIARYLRAHQTWSVFLEQRALTTRTPRWLETWRGGGVIARSLDDRLSEVLRQAGIPVVNLVDRGGESAFPVIRSDDEAIGRLGGEHLLERGFRDLAFCGFDNEAWSKRRRAAFLETVAEAGATCSVYESPWIGLEAHSWEDEQARLCSWLAGLPRPVGVLAGNDVRGQHVIDACGRLGLAVPEQVAVLGVDNDEVICNLCTPSLSSVVPNPEMVGYRAAEVLDGLMTGETRLSPEDWPMLIEPLGVATRQSTDLEAVDDPEVALALKIIREGSCRGLTVPDLLDQVLISRSSLERRFRKEVGLSPQGMIRQTQVKRAQQLLVETDLSLDQIAPLVGFKHAEHFSVVFKRQVGQTPGTYRRRFRG